MVFIFKNALKEGVQESVMVLLGKSTNVMEWKNGGKHWLEQRKRLQNQASGPSFLQWPTRSLWEATALSPSEVSSN